MKRTYPIFTLFVGLLWLTLTSCDENRLDVDVSEVRQTTSFKHFGQSFYENDSAEFYAKLPALVEEFPLFFSSGDSILWVERRFDRQLNQLWSDSKGILTPNRWAPIQTQLQNGFDHFYYYFPQEENQEVYTYVNNLDLQFPVLYIDSLNKTFIGLDVFMGENHPAYAHLPNYIKRRFSPEHIAPKVFEEIANSKLPLQTDNSTLVEDMIRMGMVRYFQEAMLRDVAPEYLFGYAKEQLVFCTEHEVNIWTYFVEKQLLFDSSIDSKRRFLFEAPFSKFYTDIDNQTPGKIGEWVGWRIVHSYMNANPDVSISELMSTTDYEGLFRKSQYKPER